MQKTQTKTESRVDFLPVIFANGIDDDSVGFVAALENARVLFDDKVYQPGEAIKIIGRKMCFDRGVIVTNTDDDIIMALGPAQTAIKVAVHEPALREVLIESTSAPRRGTAFGATPWAHRNNS